MVFMKAKILLNFFNCEQYSTSSFYLKLFFHLTHNVIKQVILLAPPKGRHVTTNFLNITNKSNCERLSKVLD